MYLMRLLLMIVLVCFSSSFKLRPMLTSSPRIAFNGKLLNTVKSARVRPMRVYSRDIGMSTATSTHSYNVDVNIRKSLLSSLSRGTLTALCLVKLPISSPSFQHVSALEVKQTGAIFIGCLVAATNFYISDILKIASSLRSFLSSIKLHLLALNNEYAIMNKPSASNQGAREAYRVTFLGGLLNVALALVKVAVGIQTGSVAMIADAGHSISDIVSDFITLVTLQLSSLPPDSDHPKGHQRFEQIGCICISLFVLSAALSLGSVAFQSFIEIANTPLTVLPSLSRLPNGAFCFSKHMPLIVSMISMVLKEQLFQVTARTAVRIKSQVLLANAWHHRSDALCSFVALLGIAGASILGLRLLDPIAALLVVGLLAINGVGMGWEALLGLTDTEVKQF